MPEMTTSAQKDKLMEDLKLVIADAEELLKLTTGQMGEKATDMRLRLQDRMDRAKADLVHVQDLALTKARDTGRAADNYVHDNPWTAIGIAAGIGALLGMLISRR